MTSSKVFIFIPVILFYCNLTLAQTPSENAKAAYNMGREYFEDGDFIKAAAEFKRAYELMPSWKILYNIAQSEAAAKHYGLALEAFEAYLVEGGDDLTTDREEMITNEIKHLKTKTGSINLTAPDGSDVLINNTLRGTTPLPGNIRVNAGVVLTLLVRKDESVLLERKIKTGSGEILDVVVDETDESSAAVITKEPAAEKPENRQQTDDAQKPEPSDNKENKTEASAGAQVSLNSSVGLAVGGWTMLAAGIAAGIAGGITGGIAISKNNELKDNCNTGTNTCPADPDLEDIKDESLLMGNLTTVLIPTASALAVTGVILLIINKKRNSESLKSRQAKNSHSKLLLPVVSPTFNGLQFRVGF